jgi:NADH-quinone oxidoreductase subunit C
MILERLKKKFVGEMIEAKEELGEFVAIVKKDHVFEILKFLKEDKDLQFNFLMDLCGMDRSKMNDGPRFEVVYQLYSSIKNHRLRVRVQVPEKESSVRSVVDLWKSANWSERECAEMYGINFEGHPNLKKLLLFEGFEGNPLRKDYPIAKRQKIPTTESKL